MNRAFQDIAFSLLGKSWEDCSIADLQRLVDQYPFFGPGELMLAKKLQLEESPLYEEQVQKTSLYFQNRLWLHHLLSSEERTGMAQRIAGAGAPVAEIMADHAAIPAETGQTASGQEDARWPVAPSEEPARTADESTPGASESLVSAAEGDAGETGAWPVDTEAPPLLAPLTIEPVDTTTAAVFEPYHTVDYFASQGIRYREEDRPPDRFSLQLKSFTEWLKTMKRIPGAPVLLNADPGSEKKVEQLAEYSVADRHIITEAMAEVWVKQGNRARAEEIYRKLSLLDPSKTAYFAAKIEELKKTS